MKLNELLEQEQQKGTYAAVRFDPATTAAIAKWVENNEVPNPVPVEKMHCTLLYSRKHCPDYEPLGEIDPAWVGKPKGLDVWDTQSGKRCLVMEFDCDELHDRHAKLMDEHGATYDFPQYKTHVSLSYDIGDFDESKLPDITKVIKELLINEEYGEDLNLNWADENGTDKDDK